MTDTAVTPTKPILHNFEAEQAVLGTMMRNNDAVWEVQEILTPEDFHTVKNRQVYEAIIHLLKETQQCDPLTIDTYLRRQSQNGIAWVDYTKELMATPPDIKAAIAYAKLIAEMATRRKLTGLGKQIDTIAHDQKTPVGESISKIEGLAFNIRNGSNGDGILTASQTMADYERKQERLKNRTDEILGLPTGWGDIDWLLDGLQKEFVYVLAGRPGMGKSAAALNIADHLTLRLNKHVAFFSLEMNHSQIIVRRVAALTGIDSQIIKKPWKYQDHQWPVIIEAQQRIKNSRLYVDDTPGIRPSQIYARSMRQKALHGLDLVIIDHFHLTKSDTSRTQRRIELNDTAEAILKIAKRLKVPVLLLAQLSRSCESRQDKRPVLADLKETGTIEEIAFAAMFLYRDEYYTGEACDVPNQAELNIAKNRDGPTGKVDLYWRAKTTQFCNLATKEYKL